MLLYHPQDKSILKSLGISEENIELIPNAIDMDEFNPSIDAIDLINRYQLENTKQKLQG